LAVNAETKVFSAQPGLVARFIFSGLYAHVTYFSLSLRFVIPTLSAVEGDESAFCRCNDTVARGAEYKSE